MDDRLIHQAEVFAKRAHSTQFRKYTSEPYWLHLREVSFLVEAVGGTDEMIAAAWLHDVVEDTPAGLYEISEQFGGGVACLVDMLTDVSKPEDGNRAERKRIDCNHLFEASPAAKTVKLADLISNSTSIVRHDPGFAKVYMNEKRDLLKVLGNGGNGELYTMASGILDRYFRSGSQA